MECESFFINSILLYIIIFILTSDSLIPEAKRNSHWNTDTSLQVMKTGRKQHTLVLCITIYGNNTDRGSLTTECWG